MVLFAVFFNQFWLLEIMIICADDELKPFIVYWLFYEAILIELFKTDVEITLTVKKEWMTQCI